MALLNPPAPTALEPKPAPPAKAPRKEIPRYGMIALTRKATRDELHHSAGRDRAARCAEQPQALSRHNPPVTVTPVTGALSPAAVSAAPPY